MPDHSKIGKSNVRRGKSHERRVAKLLTEWSGIQFRRRRTEGRDAMTIDINRTGDVIPACPEWTHFSIEAKCGKSPAFDALLTNPAKTKITEWYHQASYDAQLASDSYCRLNDSEAKDQIQPLVFWKPAPAHDWIILSEKSLHFLRNKNGSDLYESASTSPVSPRLPFPHFYFDAFRYSGEVTMNVSHTKNKKNENLIPLNLDACFMCRWKDFAEHIDPRSFFIQWPVEVAEKKQESDL
jgi:hypothetical protein